MPSKRVNNVQSFEVSLRKWGEGRPREMVLQAQRKIALEALTSLVFMTPVDRGRAMGNWQVAINTPRAIAPFKGGKRIRDGGDIEENRAIAAANSMEQAKNIKAVRRNQIIWLSNTVPYILKLEGSPVPPPTSKQAPAGMVRVTKVRLELMFGL